MFDVTGVGTLVLSWALALGALGWVTVRWPRAAGRGPAALGRRVVAQLVVSALVALAAGVTVNRHGLWFVSWADLRAIVAGPDVGPLRVRGADPAAAATTPLGPWGAAAASSSAPPPAPEGVAPQRDRAAPDLLRYTVPGPVSGHVGVVHVWLPPGHAVGRTFPALEVFHGYPVSPQSAFVNLRLDEHVAAAGRAGRPQPVVLLPDWAPGEVDTECLDGDGHAAMETWLTVDVPAWAARTLKVRPDRGSWASLGYSAGGFCAAVAAVRHPQTYAAAIVLGGYLRPELSAHYGPTVGGRPAAQAYDLVAAVAADPPPVAVLVQSSPRDTFAHPTSTAFADAARPPLSVTSWVLPDAGHRVGVWSRLVPTCLDWLAATAPGFGPAGGPT